MFLALFSCNFIPTSLVLFHYRVKVDKFAIYKPITFIANDHDLEKSSNEIYSNTFFRIKEATYIYFSICNRKYIPSFQKSYFLIILAMFDFNYSFFAQLFIHNVVMNVNRWIRIHTVISSIQVKVHAHSDSLFKRSILVVKIGH